MNRNLKALHHQKATVLILTILAVRLSLQKALKLRVVAQEGVHHKPRSEAETGDEGVEFAFTHELGVGVAEAEKQLLALTGELLREFLQIPG